MKYTAEIKRNQMRFNEVAQWNALEVAATYTIIHKETENIADHEQNEWEARVICSNINNAGAGGYIVLLNSPSLVQRAKAFGVQPIRHKLRDIWLTEALKME